MSSDRWLTYADAATLLGMTIDSLRHRARREHWGKKLNNEGKAIVLVPVDALPGPGGDTGGDAPGDAPGIRLVKRPDRHPEPDTLAVHLARIADLERRVVELQNDVAAARQERDRERDERLEERGRADKATAELAAIARQFAEATAAAASDARAREQSLQDKLDAARAQMAALRDRPWWARLVSVARG